MTRHRKFVDQRLKQLEMEFKYLELLSKEEKEYLRTEQDKTKKSTSSYGRDAWNTFDWLSLMLMFATILIYSITKYVKPFSDELKVSNYYY